MKLIPRLLARLLLCTVVWSSILATIPSQASWAAGCGSSGDNGDDFVTVTIHCQLPGGSTTSPGTESSGNQAPAYLKYMWHTPCVRFSPVDQLGNAPDCGIARTCADQQERSWQLWGLSAATRQWEYLSSQCFGRPPTAAQTPVPVVTPGMVLQAIRAIGLPSLQAHTQPEGKTLVNFATIFYTSPQPFTRTIRLLSQPVHVEATATSFTWHHGDGTVATTTTPGAPYPDKQITYAYGTAHTTVRTSVDVTYTARFRVGGGNWQSIPETVTISGPASDLRISEATAVLSGEYQ
jgi:hypothetical protein